MNQPHLFLNNLASNLFIPHIILPTRITNRSKTLIDNIFSNSLNYSYISGNITTSISDHLPQFLLIPDINIKDLLPKHHNLFKRDSTNFKKEDFILDLLDIGIQLFKLIKMIQISHLTSSMKKINCIIDNHLPLKKSLKNNLNNNSNHGLQLV